MIFFLFSFVYIENFKSNFESLKIFELPGFFLFWSLLNLMFFLAKSGIESNLFLYCFTNLHCNIFQTTTTLLATCNNSNNKNNNNCCCYSNRSHHHQQQTIHITIKADKNVEKTLENSQRYEK